MSKSIYLGMRPGDLDGKPYAKYWNPDMRPLPNHVKDALLHSHESAELGFGLDDADQLLQPGYLPLENGITRLANGQIFVAALTQMPGANGAMFEWWMGWHYMEAQRYKLWHPRAHLMNGTAEMRGDDPGLSDKEKYLTTHLVTEYIGHSKLDITITFVEPDTVFSQPFNQADPNVSAVVCGRVGLQAAPVTIGYLVHQIRQVPGGAEMRSRFWLGKPELERPGLNWLNPLLGSKLVAGQVTSPTLGHEMLVHCGMEMNHLASFLPDLYDDYHPGS